MADRICGDQESLQLQLRLARSEINNLRQQLKSLNFIHTNECNKIKETLKNWRCVECRNKESGRDDAEGAVGSCKTGVAMKEIGTIKTDFIEKRGTPRQSVICSNSIAQLTLNNEFLTNPNHALEGLQEFSHMWILFQFHKSDNAHIKAKVSPPRLNGEKIGVFATRSPHRPNPIGLSLVRINEIVGNSIYFSGVDMIDGTPVLDIKPYIPNYDNPVIISMLEPNCLIESPNLPSQSKKPIPTAPGFSGQDSDEELKKYVELKNTGSEQTLGRFHMNFGKREDPDGEEKQSSVSAQAINSDHVSTTPEIQVKVPSWIDNPPVNKLSVLFKEKALLQLNQLGTENESKKSIITNVLKEDPRSTYLREKLGSHCYVFRISELYVSCKFNDVSHTVTVYQITQESETGNND